MLVSIAALSVCLYVYAAIATVNHTAERNNFMNLSSALTAKVSELEFTDISLKNKADLTLANTLGMNEVKAPLYVSRTEPTLTLR